MRERPRPGAFTAAVEPGPGHKVCIVVVNWNARPFLERALESIAENTRTATYELIVVDNGSEDDSLDYLRGFRAPDVQRVQVIRNPENRFFSAAFNQGFNAASPDARYVMVFCNDVEAKEPGWLGDFIEAIQTPGAVASGRATRRPLPAEHRRLLLENFPDYDDPDLAERIRAAAVDPETRYWHIDGYCFLLDRARLRRAGLYLEGGPFRQYHSDWELYLRFHACGLDVASFVPRVHHWHGISELVEQYPARYAELLVRLQDEEKRSRDLREGRRLFPEESGYPAWRAQQSEKPER